ncbi:FAD binding domain-containing protein [Candidatus Sumerlaeota bacterium]|nr:FAD binding domain-containing protein [Candidatus Sumerlaeota bacterium]
MRAFEYVDVKSVDAAVKALPAGASMDEYGRKVMLKAGGIDLLDQMKEMMIAPERLVNLKAGEKDLKYIKEDGGKIAIGPLITLSELAKNPIIKEKFAALAQAAYRAATPQIRNVATVAGNLCQRPRCWYFRNNEFHCLKKGGDTCFAKEGENQYHAVFGKGPSYIVHPSNLAAPLVAVNAEIDIRGSKGNRVVKAADFFTMPDENPMKENVLEADEVIAEIRVPAGIKKSAYLDVREKQSYDWPLVAAAAALTDDGWQVVMGAVAPKPWRAKESEKILGKSVINEELAAKAGEAATAGANPLQYNKYKVDLIKVVVRRALLKAAGMEVTA